MSLHLMIQKIIIGGTYKFCHIELCCLTDSYITYRLGISVDISDAFQGHHNLSVNVTDAYLM